MNEDRVQLTREQLSAFQKQFSQAWASQSFEKMNQQFQNHSKTQPPKFNRGFHSKKLKAPRSGVFFK